MKLVYVAGPYRARTAWGVTQNIHAAMQAAARVLQVAGLYPVCPHANTAHMDGLASDEQVLAGTLELMRRCDAVLVVPGWERSVGARAEVDEAVHLGLPVMYDWGDSGLMRGILIQLSGKPAGFRLPPKSQQINARLGVSFWTDGL